MNRDPAAALLEALALRDWGRAIGAEVSETTIDLRVWVEAFVEGREFGILLPLPSAPERPDQPWIYATPTDDLDWAGMLGIWLDEELLTGGAVWGWTELQDGIPYFAIERYGLRRRDPIEHERLKALAANW